ncbi:methyl-accepting chemotaxis protein [Lutispora thermophila]|uniref:Methyl-accepting chemotaxis sensory transducer with Cache sensor n=1 Tax=Lutispora thermophila DSM 19022 TaxID=1122184 RepID=A0A1M6H7D2_9FIRM|nr:methyl-accepting chemotaxis protein [Lutispora thermophila]SHJ18105.1 methyl-accepting chemotaxis sensory transducer with Cache sensor [Lutispora thermophila DSM 19022]
MRFKSIRAALLSITISLVVIGMFAVTATSYFFSKAIINNEIEEKMSHQINTITEGIEKRLWKHEQLAINIAKSVESTIHIKDKNVYISMLKSIVDTNEDTYGNGIWFEPYEFSAEEKYFGPYAYKDGNNIELTMDYSNEQYDYFAYDWYQKAKNSGGEVQWSNPYYDEISDITMITTSVPFFHNGEVKGVVTADINLSSIQELISNTVVGETGKAFLINREGLFIAHSDSEKVMKENILNDPNQSFSEVGKRMLESKNGNASYLDGNEKYKLYYYNFPKTNWIIGLTISEKELYEPLNVLLRNVVILFFVCISIVTLVIILFTKNIISRIVKIKATAELLAQGDLTVKCDVNSKDELGALSNSFDRMINNMKKLLIGVRNVAEEAAHSANSLAAISEETVASSEEVCRAVEDIAKGAGEQASDAEQSSINAASLDEKFEQLKIKSKTMYDNAKEVNDANKDGIIAVEELIKKTKLNNESMIKIQETIKDLNIKSSKINEILGTISSIAGQTNLLALNASIEAARAGEAGRGFAVVAEEIRKLAEESKEAADKIKEIVEELQAENNNAIERMSEVKYITQEQTSAVEGVNRTFSIISRSIGNITDEIDKVNKFIDELSINKDIIVKSISSISAVSEETAAATEEVTASLNEQVKAIEEVAKNAERLNELSMELNQQINQFKFE